MNVKLLREVQKVILEEPKRLDMSEWASHDMQGTPKSRQPSCGTVGCISGWAAMLHRLQHHKLPRNKKNVRELYVDDLCETAGKDALDLSDSEASALFYTDNWPQEFNQRFHKARTYQHRAKVTVDRIDAFIKEHEGQ